MEIKLPSQPKIEPQPDRGEDLRRFAVVPVLALKDKRLKNHAFRVLAAICAHANRAGVTYVGQRTLATFLQSYQSYVGKGVKQLKELGYIRVIGKPVQGLRGETLQVMYEPGIDVNDAVAIASAKTDEDLRPPEQREQELAEMIANQDKEWSEQELRDNRDRLAKLLLQAFKTPQQFERMYQPVKGDTQAVKKAKEQIRARMRELKKQEYEDQAVNYQSSSKQKNICSDIQEYVVCDNLDREVEKNSSSEQRGPMTYEAIVNYLKANLFNGVKSEDDLQGCAWLSDLNVTVEQLERYLVAYPSDTAYQLCKRVIAGMS